MAAKWTTRRAFLLIALTLFALGLTGCGPESSRQRGGGRGADPGNRGDPVQLVGDTGRNQRIYYQTPDKAMGEE